MDVEPATLDQIRRGKDGRWTVIEDDVGNFARQLRDIDDTLRLRYSEAGGYFVVYQQFPDGDQHLVTTAKELDGRLIRKMRIVCQPEYDAAAEADRIDRERDRQADERLSERTGEVGERLAHAFRKDLGVKSRVSLSGAFKGVR